MEQSYNHKRQSGDLTGAIERARKHRAKGVNAGRIALGATACLSLIGSGVLVANHATEQKQLAPPEEYVAGRVIVKFDRKLEISLQADGNVVTGIDEVDALNKEISGETYEQLVPSSDDHDIDNYYIIDVPLDIELDELVRDFSRIDEVEYAQYDTIFHAPELYSPEIPETGENSAATLESTLPNDKYFNTDEGSWGQDYEDQWPLHRLNVAEAWEIAKGDEIDIWVLDTGIDPVHPDLEGRMSDRAEELGYNFFDMNKDTMDRYGHGTLTSGAIGAATNNEIGIAGVTWNGKFIPIKVYSDEGTATLSSFTRGIVYSAANGAKLMNMSMTGHAGPDTKPIDEAMEYSYSQGAVMLVSAGNDNHDARKNTPANSPFGITIAAVDHTGTRASFSNWGPAVDVAAPGVGTLTLISREYIRRPRTIVGEHYTVAGGTSLAAPYTTGEVALMFAANPDLIGNPEAVMRIVKAAVTPYESDKYIGTGIINYALAVQLALEYEPEDSDKVPPHLERIAYLYENLEGIHPLRYSPHFKLGEMARDCDDRLVVRLTRKTPLGRRLLLVVDEEPLDNEGTIDTAIGVIDDRQGFRACILSGDELGDMQKTFDLFYLISTDAWYRALTEGNKKVQGNVGKREFQQFSDICDEADRWEPIDPDSDMLDILQLTDEQ